MPEHAPDREAPVDRPGGHPASRRRLARTLLLHREPVGSAAWTLLSQLSGSVSNVLVLVAVSRTGSPSDVGAVAIPLLVFQLSAGLFRPCFGEVLVVARHKFVDATVSSAFHALAVGASLAAFVVAGVALLLPSGIRAALLVLALALPALLTQDLLRYLSFSERRAVLAAAGDTVWLGGLAVFVLVVELWTVDVTAAQWVAWWAGSGVASVAVMRPGRLLASRRAAPGWWAIGRSHARHYLPEFLLGAGLTLLPQLLVAVVGSATDVGELRLATSFLGPIPVVWAAGANVFIPYRVRRPVTGIRPEAVFAAALTAVALAWVIVGVVMPVDLGSAVMGSTWAGSQEWLPAVGPGYVLLAISGGAVVGLRVRGASASAVRARLVAAPMSLIGTGVGYALWGSRGYGGAFCAACGVLALMAWWQLRIASSARC